MSSISKSLLSGLAVLAATSGAAPTATATVEAPARALTTAHRAAAHVCRSPADADDLVGQVSLRLWQRHRDVLEEDNARSRRYIQTAIRNARVDQNRRRHREILQSDAVDADAVSPAMVQEAVVVDPLSRAEVEEFRRSLEPEDLQVLGMLEEGHTDRDIARLTDRTRHSVRKSVERLRHRATRYL